MKEKRGWYFPTNMGGQDEGFENQGINQFKMSPYGKLAREIIQNSYDAKKESEKKVKVEFRLEKIKKSKIPNLDSIIEGINASAEYFPDSERLEKFRQKANEKYENDTIDVLKISDYNTKGLQGIDKRRGSDWYGLIKSSGNSPKKGSSGGSYGAGKHAAFVFSYFRTILYGTYVEEEGYAFQGKSILCSHKKDGVLKSNIGFWGNIYENECKPVRNQEDMDDFYKRNESGTDVYVIGAKLEKEKWFESIIYSVVENFWKLIIEDKLEVKIIDNGTDIDINYKNVRALAEKGKNENIKIDDGESFEAYKFIELNDSVKEVKYGSICEENDVELKIAKMPQYPEKRILKMRDKEMKIEMLSPRKRPVNFIALVTATGKELNRQLRESEPQTHDKWSADNVEDEGDKKIIGDTIKRLNNWINEQINDLIYIDDEDEFDAEGIDFLNIEDEDIDGEKNEQNPFDDIENSEIELQEILTMPKENTSKIINKNDQEDPKAGGEELGDENIREHGGNALGEGEKDPDGGGKMYHEVQMEYVKTPYDSEKNIYKVIIKPKENINNCEIRFLRLTDSNVLEKVEIEAAYIKGEKVDFFENIVKDIELKQDEDTIIELLLKRKCIMEVKIYVQS